MRATSRGMMVVAALIGLLTIALWMALRDRASPPPSGVAGSERSLPVAGVPVATSGGGEADESAELAPPIAQSEPQHRESVAAGDHRIRGRVLDPMGRPAEGALAGVVGILGDQPAQSGDTATATCDAAGSFVLDVPPSLMGELLVIGRQKGFRPAWLRVARDAIPGDLELRLEVGCVIEGVVLRNGAPLPGASLSLDLRYGVPGVFGSAARRSGWRGASRRRPSAPPRTSRAGSGSPGSRPTSIAARSECRTRARLPTPPRSPACCRDCRGTKAVGYEKATPPASWSPSTCLPLKCPRTACCRSRASCARCALRIPRS